MQFRCHILSQTCTLKLWFSPISMNHKAAGCVCVQECVTHLHELPALACLHPVATDIMAAQTEVPFSLKGKVLKQYFQSTKLKYE